MNDDTAGPQDPVGEAIDRGRTEFRARVVLREVCDRLTGLSGDEDGSVEAADSRLSLPLTLAILSSRRDSLIALDPEDPLVKRAENAIRSGYRAMGMPAGRTAGEDSE